ncbi:MAG: hypothetical protein C0500_08795 [Sphingobium sp.]|jgi:hypothetical protein|nr:hypothetical protein [Sphingobium sp.]
MLAGLLFAIDDADDRPDTLVATLPFGGGTLLEFQARLLIAAGISQIAVVVARLTPELIGAINRIGRRGIAVDAVRSAAEAVAKLHPLASVLVLADGLVTTGDIVASMVDEQAGDEGDLLLVTSDADALPGLERVGRDAIWAGLARVQPTRLAEVAALPEEYDFQSTLLRVCAQGGAVHLALPASRSRAGHGIEHDSARLRGRNDAVLAAYVSNRVSWVERWLIAPVARAAMPWLVGRAVPGTTLAGAAGAVMLGGLALTGGGWSAAGLALVFLAVGALSIGTALAWLRDEAMLARVQQGLIAGGAALAALLLGWAAGGEASLVAALALVVLGGLAERAANERIRQRWWAQAAAFPLLLLPFAAAGQPLAGLLVAAGYAGLTLGAAIEALREKP